MTSLDLRWSACAALLAVSTFPAMAQGTRNEVWPETDLYVNWGPHARLVIIDSFNQDQDTKNGQGSFSYLFDLALKPVFRRELRGREDVFRQRFLSFRTGYQYTTSLVNGDPSSQTCIVAQFTAQGPLPGKFVLVDRNRGDFRFVNGQPFSMRYRNRIWLERDFELGRLVFTPCVYDEIYFDTGKSAWVPNRFAAGLQIPAGVHLVLEPNYVRQNNRLATPRHVNAAGLTFNFYF